MRNQEVQAFATIYATAVGEYAMEDIARKRGYFTTAVVEALSGKAANERGEVTLSAVVKYVQEQVPHRVKLMVGHEQKPFAVIEGFKADELVIAAVEPPALPASQVPGVVTPLVPQIEFEFWTSIKNSDDPEDYEEYLARWPQGDFASLARRRREVIRRAEKQRQEEAARQREAQAQREREQEALGQRELDEQRQAEAARLAEEQRQQEEQQRLHEQERQRELEAARQRQLEAQRQEELARQREQQAQREREEAARL
ncbi:MAG: hypothetical protein ABI977_07120, partial [Acidobacteriota bacterium]